MAKLKSTPAFLDEDQNECNSQTISHDTLQWSLNLLATLWRVAMLHPGQVSNYAFSSTCTAAYQWDCHPGPLEQKHCYSGGYANIVNWETMDHTMQSLPQACRLWVENWLQYFYCLELMWKTTSMLFESISSMPSPCSSDANLLKQWLIGTRPWKNWMHDWFQAQRNT